MNVLAAFCILILISSGCSNVVGEGHKEIGEEGIQQEMDSTEINRLERLKYIQSKSVEAKQFCKARKLNTSFYIHIDLSMHSGLKRFFIWDFAADSITQSFLVSHGCCGSAWGADYTKNKAGVSNRDGSHCSSIGKYIIGARGYSNWGINVKYLLHGVDTTNSNALKRLIVLHGWESVSDEEIYPRGTPEGWGCPAVSNKTMQWIDEKLKGSEKKVLMWVTQ